MEIIKNKPIRTIGFEESSLTKTNINIANQVDQFAKLKEKYNITDIDIISPQEFLNLENKNAYQYFISFTLDMNLRKKVCDVLDKENLDCPSFIDETSIVYNSCIIGKGVSIAPFSLIQNCTIGNYCTIESHCLVAHNVNLGRNCIIHPGTLIAGKTNIGENCTFGLKSSVINNVNVVDNVNLGAFSNITKDITKPGRYVGTIAKYVGEFL